MNAPELAVVVPTRNRGALLEDCLESLLAQDTAREFEIVVVDDGSTDDTPERVRALEARGPIVYVRRDPSGLNASRNAGAAATTANVLAFVDDDVLAPPGYVDAVIEGVRRHEGAGCFGGRIRLRLEGKAPRRCGREPLGETELEAGDAERSIPNAWGANLIVERAMLEAAGPFSEGMGLYGDEVEWQHRVRSRGGDVVYLPAAWLWHRRTADELRLGKMLRRNFRKGLTHPAALVAMEQYVSPVGGVRHVVFGVGHALRRGCAVGLLQAALGWGHTVGAVRLLLRKEGSPFVRWGPARRRR